MVFIFSLLRYDKSQISLIRIVFLTTFHYKQQQHKNYYK